MDQFTRRVQVRLNDLGFDTGAPDGILGRKTKAAIKAFQRREGLRSDGIVGPKTREELFPDPMPQRDRDPWFGRGSNQWPRQKNISKFFGKAGGPQCTAGKVDLPFKFRIAWNKKQRIGRFSCHELVADPFERVFKKTHEAYGQKAMQDMGLDLFGGCFNFRKMRGGSRLSMHSWGVALDLDPARNRLRWNSSRAQFAKPEYDEFWRIVKSEGLVGLGPARNFDWMHIQAARL